MTANNEFFALSVRKESLDCCTWDIKEDVIDHASLFLCFTDEWIFKEKEKNKNCVCTAMKVKQFRLKLSADDAPVKKYIYFDLILLATVTSTIYMYDTVKSYALILLALIGCMSETRRPLRIQQSNSNPVSKTNRLSKIVLSATM
jgi:hypothetical protein